MEWSNYSKDPHAMDQSLVALGVLLQDPPVHDLPCALLLQLLHILVNELILINKLEIQEKFSNHVLLKCGQTSTYISILLSH